MILIHLNKLSIVKVTLYRNLTMFAMLAVFVIGIISSSYAQTENPQKIICENEIIENGVFKSITIQPNSECVIRNVQVLKNLIMLNSADIELSGSTIGGNIIVKESTDDVNIEINDSIIEKNIRIVQSADRDVTLRISNSEIKKNIILKNQHIDDFEITNTKIGNNIRIVNNEIGDDVRIDSSDISGNIVINKNTSESEIEIKSTSIGKNLKANLNNLQTDFTIDSNLTIPLISDCSSMKSTFEPCKKSFNNKSCFAIIFLILVL